MRRSDAHPDNCSQHTPMPSQGQSPLLVPFAWKPDGTYATTRPESNVPMRPMPTTQAGALLKQPVTPPAKFPKQEDLPSTSKKQKISGEESRTLLQTIVSEEKVQHSLRGDVLALWQPLPGDAASRSSEQPSRSACPPASEDLLSDEEQGSFTAALRMALATVQQQYEEVKGMMVQEEQWSSLQLIQHSLNVMSTCVTANHAGADKDWRRSTAVGTVDLLCRNLSVSPLLHSCVAELQKWDGHAQSLQVVRNCLDAHWPEMKASLGCPRQVGGFAELDFRAVNFGIHPDWRPRHSRGGSPISAAGVASVAGCHFRGGSPISAAAVAGVARCLTCNSLSTVAFLLW